MCWLSERQLSLERRHVKVYVSPCCTSFSEICKKSGISTSLQPEEIRIDRSKVGGGYSQRLLQMKQLPSISFLSVTPLLELD